MYQRIWVGQPQSCCHRVLKTTRRCANSRQHTSWQPKGSNCEKAPGHTISYDTLSHPEILLYVWQHIVAKVGEYNPKPGIPENTDVKCSLLSLRRISGTSGLYILRDLLELARALVLPDRDSSPSDVQAAHQTYIPYESFSPLFTFFVHKLL